MHAHRESVPREIDPGVVVKRETSLLIVETVTLIGRPVPTKQRG